MENASKALIMAGSVLIALMIIGALLLMFNSLSSYQQVGEQNTKEAQVIAFNNQFETYLRNNVRGSDMISLMHRILDYNNRKGDNSSEKFQQMNIKISGINVSNLKYDTNDSEIIFGKYTQDTIGKLIEDVQKLENKYQAKSIAALSSSINKVMDSEEDTKKILPKLLDNYGGYTKIKEDTAMYYQYSQFKRLYFDCDTNKTKYDEKTGRILEIEFNCTNKLG